MNKKFISMCKGIAFILAVVILSFLVGYLISRAWTEPSASPPDANVSAPINVGSEAQVKEGSPGTIAAGGFLGQVPGYGIYPDPGAASTIGSSLTITGSTTYLRLPLLTTTQRNTLTPGSGMMIYNSTVNEVQVYVPSEWKKLASGFATGTACTVPAQCDTNYCVDGYCCDTACSGGVCQTCGSLSSNGVGYCGYVTGTTNDPDNECTTASPGAAGSCKSNYCSGTGAACGYLTGEQSQSVCKRCSGSSYDPVNFTDNTQDTEGSNLCSSTCKKCSSGSCINQGVEDLFSQCSDSQCYTGNCDGSGACGYQTSSQDLYSYCGTTNCLTGNCKGGTNVCGWYTTGEGNCAACKYCDGATSGTCVNRPNDTQDTTSPGTCSTTCKKCSAGSCVNQISSQDLFSQCGTTNCYTGNCSGAAASCGYYTTGEGNCAVCKYCDGATSGTCVNRPAGTQDTTSPGTCTATHYRCDGSGNCTAPATYTCVDCNGVICDTVCASYDFCQGQSDWCYGDFNPIYCSWACPSNYVCRCGTYTYD